MLTLTVEATLNGSIWHELETFTFETFEAALAAYAEWKYKADLDAFLSGATWTVWTTAF